MRLTKWKNSSINILKNTLNELCITDNKTLNIIYKTPKYTVPVHFDSSEEVTYKLCSCLSSLIKSTFIINFSFAITFVSENHNLF